MLIALRKFIPVIILVQYGYIAILSISENHQATA